ncbi:hypothetical protein ADIS_0732 [Lunatimonas lonarensis]|uniref:Uncharacterized protein n=1 Tax=Lunatimonas lonarensis TaxID=1232681 RepID=R7ZXE2_9BACT|nr:hypothetical protein ADIS_0732 [Lunatimonas lonarensis]
MWINVDKKACFFQCRFGGHGGYFFRKLVFDSIEFFGLICYRPLLFIPRLMVKIS